MRLGRGHTVLRMAVFMIMIMLMIAFVTGQEDTCSAMDGTCSSTDKLSAEQEFMKDYIIHGGPGLSLTKEDYINERKFHYIRTKNFVRDIQNKLEDHKKGINELPLEERWNLEKQLESMKLKLNKLRKIPSDKFIEEKLKSNRFVAGQLEEDSKNRQTPWRREPGR